MLVIRTMAFQLIEHLRGVRKVVEVSRPITISNHVVGGGFVPFQLTNGSKVVQIFNHGCGIGSIGVQGSPHVVTTVLTLSVVRLLIRQIIRRVGVILLSVVTINIMHFVVLKGNEVAFMRVITGLPHFREVTLPILVD